jgi:hypothetical protein
MVVLHDDDPRESKHVVINLEYNCGRRYYTPFLLLTAKQKSMFKIKAIRANTVQSISPHIAEGKMLLYYKVKTGSVV